jgi:ribosome-associated protein
LTDQFEDELPSKTQKKREMQDLREMGEKLVLLTDDQLAPISDPELIKAILEYRRINKGNARKRQLQYIAKLMSKTDIEDIRNLIDRYDASSRNHARQFHQLETWREQLILGDYTAIDDIAAEHPNLDRQHLKQLTRKAIQERTKNDTEDKPGAPVHFRRLFKYLKTLSDSQT